MDGLRHATVAALAAAMAWGWASGPAAAEVALVAVTGQTAPGAGAVTFVGLRNPVLNGAGQVAFRGNLSDGGEGIWLREFFGVFLVTRSGDAAPGAGGATFTFFSEPALNGAGKVAFACSLSDGGEGIWLGGPAGLALVAKTGNAAPGAGGATFTGLNSPVLNGAGEVAFIGGLNGGGEGIWLGGAAGLALVAKTGDAAPGAGGATFTSFNSPVLNGASEMAFFGELSDGGEGIWLGGPAGLALVAKTGGAAPGAGGATWTDFGNPVLNGAGRVAFRGTLSGVGGSIWVGGAAGLDLVAKTGDPAPGTAGAPFVAFGRNPTLNGAGEVVFRGTLNGGGRGIWAGGAAGLVLVARSGDEAPGAGGATFTDFNRIVQNGAGEVAFEDFNLSDGGQGIWAGPSGGPQIIARDGDDIELVSGDARTVTGLSFGFAGGTGNEGGQRSGFNEGGQTAFSATFTDTSEAILLSPPDAPTVHRMPYRAVDGTWNQVMLPRSFRKPVIIAGPASSANKAPGVVRLRKIDGAEGRFEARFQEWRYLNGSHPEERVDFLVLERGRFREADGSDWEAGIVKAMDNRVWRKARFKRRFRKPPHVFLTVQSFKGRKPIAARVRNVTKKGFEFSIQEEEKDLAGGHPKEKVGYLAALNGLGTISGGVAGTGYRLKLARVNQRLKTMKGERIKLEEEKSSDKERKHKKEAVSVMFIGRGLFAQQASDREPDTTAIRRR